MRIRSTRARAGARELDVAGVLERFLAVRARTMSLCEPLSPEDCTPQAATEASPVHWQLAHTTWFFETFVLEPAGFAPFHPHFGYLFNSYYNAVGERVERSKRGLVTRPGRAEILAYRHHVDARMREFFDSAHVERLEALAPVALLGTHHEEQHQELILTDLKLLFSHNPLRPAYRSTAPESRAPSQRNADAQSAASGSHGDGARIVASSTRGAIARRDADAPNGARDPRTPRGALADATGSTTASTTDTTAASTADPLRFIAHPEELATIGHEGASFAFDNEGPAHRVFLESFDLATRPVTNGEYLAFMREDGYARADLWLSDGWDAVRAQGWKAPLYWEMRDGEWWSFTLAGMQRIELSDPVVHVSYFEADAYARWAGARLPSEAEWERAAHALAVEGNFVESGAFRPLATRAANSDALAAMFGDVWEWTQSPYVAYPRYRPIAGALGEYNGKFMCNQFVLRGGSCVSPRAHLRATYRNFFPPAARWQFSGFRLARDG